MNKWDLIFDFTKNVSGNKSNFKILEPENFKIFSKTVDGVDAQPVAAFPYPQRYGGTIADDANQQFEKKDDMMAFGFNTSQADAQK